MAEQTVTLEELFKMRGDIAIAVLETVEQQLEIVHLTLKQLRVMDEHYKLKKDLNTTGIMDIVTTLRHYKPDLTEGKTDAEVLALFGKDAG